MYSFSPSRLVYGNHSSEKILGYSRDDVADKNLWELQNTVGMADVILEENNTVSTRTKTSSEATFEALFPL